MLLHPPPFQGFGSTPSHPTSNGVGATVEPCAPVQYAKQPAGTMVCQSLDDIQTFADSDTAAKDKFVREVTV